MPGQLGGKRERRWMRDAHPRWSSVEEEDARELEPHLTPTKTSVDLILSPACEKHKQGSALEEGPGDEEDEMEMSESSSPHALRILRSSSSSSKVARRKVKSEAVGIEADSEDLEDVIFCWEVVDGGMKARGGDEC
jgi:hypothetical protein